MRQPLMVTAVLARVMRAHSRLSPPTATRRASAALGESLAEKPLFEAPRILPGLVAKENVLVLLGSNPGSESLRADLSLWDLRAMMALKGGINAIRPQTLVDIVDVEFKPGVRPNPDTRKARPELFDERVSVCSIGSPRACWASESIMSEMFGVPAFGEPDKTLPFHFVWSSKIENLPPSTFAVPVASVKGLEGADARALSLKGARGLKVGRRVYVAKTARGRWKSYGVIVSQRRATGQVFLVLAGLSAPATLGTALALVKKSTGTLPEPAENGGHGPVRWAVIEATGEDEGGPWDARKVEEFEVVHTELHHGADGRLHR
ncbi:MAG: hypothetical protein E2P02_05100 [Acidobacteria bacterium]|nr:MAG: hypothetical protein E2P02_05100 [Acidobacteriota bacterium]